MSAEDLLHGGGPGVAEVLDSPEVSGKLVRGGTLRVLAYAGGLLGGLASPPLVVRHLGVVAYGRYATVASLIFIVGAIPEAGLSALGLRDYATLDTAGRASLVRNLVGLRIVLVTLASMLAVGFALAVGYTDTMVLGTLVMGTGAIFAAYLTTLQLPLQARLRLGWVSVNDFTRQLAIAVGMVALVIAGASLLPFYFVVPLSALIPLAITITLVHREIPLLPAFEFRYW